MTDPVRPGEKTPQGSAAPVLGAVDARGGARRGIYVILGISLTLAIAAMIVAWLIMGGGSRTTRPQADPMRPPLSAASPSAAPRPGS